MIKLHFVVLPFFLFFWLGQHVGSTLSYSEKEKYRYVFMCMCCIQCLSSFVGTWLLRCFFMLLTVTWYGIFVELSLIFLPSSLSLLHSFPPSRLLTLSLSSTLFCHIVFINIIIFLYFLLYLYSLQNYAYPADELMPLSCKGRVRGREPSRGDVDDSLGR